MYKCLSVPGFTVSVAKEPPKIKTYKLFKHLNEPLANHSSERFIFGNREAEETRRELALKSLAAKVASLVRNIIT
jgi:hypothetical protein